LRRLFEPVPPPPAQQKANGHAVFPTFIEDTIPLPSLLRLRSSSYLEALYSKQHLSAREIARLAEVSRSMVLEALDRLGIPQNGNGHKRTGHVPFGFACLNHQLVKNKAEQATST